MSLSPEPLSLGPGWGLNCKAADWEKGFGNSNVCFIYVFLSILKAILFEVGVTETPILQIQNLGGKSQAGTGALKY